MSGLDALLNDLVVANRTLAQERVVDAFGHVSTRHPSNPERFFLSRSRAPELVAAGDLMEFDLEGQPVDQRGRAVYGERAIHAAVYEARPDVMAVCHNHSRAVVPFGLISEPIRPLMHMTSIVGRHIPVWDIAEEFGPSDLMVTSMDRGRSLARALGGNRVALMRGHGCVVVGPSIPQVVMISVYLQLNAELQLQLQACGFTDVRYLTPEEVDLASARQLQAGPINKAWEYWRNRVGEPAG